MPNTVKRLNYYDHQFLRAPDFTDEQNYHLTMRRLHNSLLHTWGIAQGLKVTVAGGGTGTAVTVSAGVAIDSTGREMVLPTDTNLELGGEAAGTTLYITIAYGEQQSDPTTEAGGPGNTRWTEQPNLTFSINAPADKSMTLILGKVPRTASGLGTVDESDRKLVGVVLPNDLTVDSVTLKQDGVAQSNWPALSCSGANQLAVANASLNLDAQREIVFADNGQIRSLDQNHKIVFNRAQNLLDLYEFGDIRFLTGSPASEKMRVQASGNVGLGTNVPLTQLHIRKDNLGGLGPTLTLMNGSGGAGAGGSLDFDGYNAAANPPTARIQSLDDGAFSSHLSFSSKQPGAATNQLVERMRIGSDGSVGVGTVASRAKLQVSGMVGNSVGLFGDMGISLVAAWPNVGFNSYFNAGWKSISPGFAGLISLDQSSGAMAFYLAPAKLAAADAPFAPTPWLSIQPNGKMNNPMWAVNQLLNQVQGPLPINVSFNSGGGTLVIMFDGSGWSTSGGNIGLFIQLDGGTIGTTRTFTNEPNSHKTFTTNILVQGNVAGGAHTLTLGVLANTLTDVNDWFNLTVLELPF